MLCGKLHCQKGFKLNSFSYKYLAVLFEFGGRGGGRGRVNNVACLPVFKRPSGLSRAQLHFLHMTF